MGNFVDDVIKHFSESRGSASKYDRSMWLTQGEKVSKENHIDMVSELDKFVARDNWATVKATDEWIDSNINWNRVFEKYGYLSPKTIAQLITTDLKDEESAVYKMVNSKSVSESLFDEWKKYGAPKSELQVYYNAVAEIGLWMDDDHAAEAFRMLDTWLLAQYLMKKADLAFIVDKYGKLKPEVLAQVIMQQGGTYGANIIFESVSDIAKPMLDFINGMIKDKIYQRTLNFRNNDGMKRFIKDIQPAIDMKIVRIKKSGMRVELSLGQEAIDRTETF